MAEEQRDNPRGTVLAQEAHDAYIEYVNSGFENLGPDKMALVEVAMRWMARGMRWTAPLARSSMRGGDRGQGSGLHGDHGDRRADCQVPDLVRPSGPAG